VALVSLLISEAQKLILGQHLSVYTPDDVGGILNSKGGLWLSDSHFLKYQVQLVEGTEVTLKTCQAFNPLSFLREGEGKPEHSCEEVLMRSYATRPELSDQSLDNPNLVLYIDGNSFVKNGIRYARFEVVVEFVTFQ
jgi:hypothetical protein